MTLVWSDEALCGLRRIAESRAARPGTAILGHIVEAVAMLERFPRMGRCLYVAEGPELRELIVDSFRVAYRVGTDDLTILAIQHSRRAFDPRQLTLLP